MAALYRNHFRGIFACTSEAVRGDLLKMYPELEYRSVVVNDIVSHEYYLDECSSDYRSNIIRSNICSTTEPKFLNPREKQNFYERNLQNKSFPYIMMVSSLEPRKNHLKMIGAWDYLKNNGMPDLKLIVVGELGWDYENILEAMAPWQLRGELYHLHRVPSPQLRLLYNGAAAVVCPSLNEGFDLSGIEAMLCGGAVVASDIPVHREIYGDACGYFNPYSTLEMARAIREVIAPEAAGRRQELVDIGLAHAPKYRRESLAPQWREIFERLRGGDFTRRR
jgi:glycosyltransferase involved in cell wall biosynthesis